MFCEDLSAFFDVAGGHAVAATLAGRAVQVVLDTESQQDFDAGLVTQAPAALLRTSQAAAAAPGQALAVGAAIYTVRQVLREPPDGALTRLVLAR